MAYRACTAFLQARVLGFLTPRQFHRQARTFGSAATRMEPSRVKYDFIEDVERLDYYVPGGYHPAMIGDEFCEGRYVIAHKLGFGRSSTVWLGKDRNSGRLVTLKITTAESAERSHELRILSRLREADSQLPGKTMVQSLLDSFLFSGPNGTHHCLVMDAARVNIHEAKDASYHRLLHLPAARAIAAQLVFGLQFIHNQGIVHGDLHLANILLCLPSSMGAMTQKQLYTKTGEPIKEGVVRSDGAPLDSGVPSEVVVPIWLGLGSDEITAVDSPVLLADFGEAFDPQATEQFTAHTPPLLTPPEAFFAEPGVDEPLSFPADIWTLACTIWELFGSGPPFQAFPATLDEVTIEHVEMLGKLPEQWWNKWEARNNWFDDNGNKNVKEGLCQYYSNSCRSWGQRFPADIQSAREWKNFDMFLPDEEKAFGDMIRSMLVFEPSKRATIEDLVRCEWMQRWGTPEMQRMQGAVRDTLPSDESG
ncbi:CMGC/SRPK protein kinase [Helicocarpus griseus UAMH5409]|uniref:non-specific serine/threonine protein kinase n=1 Tax=Helicocarpus griseus UAMH5409 TaxID=1447875 RepID=A0A2B7X368_9EURO|nr:CMGC/SRPK protein kinase [Helicocarpus griseus UAMH5409]